MSNKIHILLLEDELLLAQDLKSKLEELGYGISHVRSGEATLKQLKKEVPDLAILDIEIDGEMDGLEIGSYIRKTYNLPILYVTQFKDLQTFKRAKKSKPISYLTKPVNLWDLVRAIELSLEHTAVSFNRESENYLLPKAIYLKSSEQSFEKIAFDDLYFLKAAGSYTEIYTSSKRFLFSDNISYYEKKLISPYLLRVHRSWLINVHKVEKIEENNLIIKGVKVPIGKTYKKTVLSRFTLIS